MPVVAPCSKTVLERVIDSTCYFKECQYETSLFRSERNDLPIRTLGHRRRHILDRRAAHIRFFQHFRVVVPSPRRLHLLAGAGAALLLYSLLF